MTHTNLLDNSGPELIGPPGRPIATANGPNPACFIDRWWGYRQGATGHTIGILGGSGYPNCIVMKRNAGDASNAPLVVGQSTGRAATGLSTMDIVQRALDRRTPGLSLDTLVFSVYACKGANFSGSGLTLEILIAGANVNVCSGAWTVEATATFGSSAIRNDAWTRFQVTKSGLWTANALVVLGVRARFDAPSGVAGNDDTLLLTGAKLELSPTGTATAYSTPTIHESLQRCKRFYQAFGGANGEITAAGSAAGASLHQQTHLFPVEMISVPTATKAGTWAVSNCSQPTIAFLTTRAFVLATTTAGAGPFSYQTNSRDDAVIFDAEVA